MAKKVLRHGNRFAARVRRRYFSEGEKYGVRPEIRLIGMCSGSCWFKLVCDNSSKVLLAHFEQFFIKYQVDCSKLNPLYESLAGITYLSFRSFNSSDGFLLLQVFDR